VSNEGAIRIRKGKTLGEIENYIQKQQLEAIVYSGNDILFENGLSREATEFLLKANFQNTAQRMVLGGKNYYVRHFQFELWNWHIVLLKEEKVYADLTSKVQHAYIGTWGVLLIGSIFLVYYLKQVILAPINAIITSIRADEHPDYRGAYEFEFLSQNIAEMMVKQKQRELEMFNQSVQLREAQTRLMTSARNAGIAQIATNVLHNVGNVLNSVNTSAGLLNRIILTSKVSGLAKAAKMLKEHSADLGDFLTHDEKGKLLPEYLDKLTDTLESERLGVLEELGQLTKSIDHIKKIVATQQSYAGVVSVVEMVQIRELLEDALRMNAEAFMRHQVTVLKEFEEVAPLPLDKHQMLLIIINLISNAKQAMSGITDRAHQITLRVKLIEERLSIQVRDEGEGIPPENLTRIFGHGFSTRKEGHGFGLHSCALAARDMGGTLTAYSEGMGKGATFTVEIPIRMRDKI
jgi:signal transduction histidine kinase